jgi:hypothetical protein
MSAMAKAQKGKGDAFVKDAEALLNKKSWFSSKTKNAEDAAELYEQAANAYKVGGLNQEAGDAYSKAAAIYRDTLSDFNSASKNLNNAGESGLETEATGTSFCFLFCLCLCELFCLSDTITTTLVPSRKLLQKVKSNRCHCFVSTSCFSVCG